MSESGILILLLPTSTHGHLYVTFAPFSVEYLKSIILCACICVFVNAHTYKHAYKYGCFGGNQNEDFTFHVHVFYYI